MWFEMSCGQHGKFATRVLMSALCFAALSACSPRVAVHGDQIPAEKLAQIRPAQDTKASVSALLGSPSSVSVFDNEAWYYIGDRTETTTFLAPEVVERQVVVVRFDGAGRVTTVEKFGLEKGREVDVVTRTTPSRGSEITVVEQLISNVGRFNREESQRRGSPGEP